MTSPYLNRPLVSLAVVLPRMLAQIETELATATGPAEEQWLRQRAELIRGLLAPQQSPIEARRCGGIASQAGGDGVTALGVWRTSSPTLPPRRA